MVGVVRHGDRVESDVVVLSCSVESANRVGYEAVNIRGNRGSKVILKNAFGESEAVFR